MSKVIYGTGNTQVVLDNIKTERYQKTPVLDANGNYLYTRHALGVLAVYNPQYVSASRTTFPNFQVNTTSTGPVTEQALRHALSQPRKNLEYWVGTTRILQSPGVFAGGATTQYPADATNGPKPLDVSVVQLLGERSFAVRFVVSTDVNECGVFNGSSIYGVIPPTDIRSAMLAHTFASAEELDQDWFAVRTTRGEVKLHRGIAESVFRTSTILPVDKLRAFLLSVYPPLPGMMRIKQEVRVSPDGITLEYLVVDREVAASFTQAAINAGVTRIEADLHRTAGFSGGRLLVGSALSSSVSAGIQAATSTTGRGASRSAGFIAAAAAGGAAAASTFFSTGIRPTPITSYTMTCRVWGRRNTTRQNLHIIAARAIDNRLFSVLPAFGNDWSAHGSEAQHDLMGRFVSVSVNITTGPLGNVGGGEATTNFAFLGVDFFGSNDFILGVTTGPEVGQTQVGSKDTGTRGEANFDLFSSKNVNDCGAPTILPGRSSIPRDG
jgi:hypothetical protein